MKSIRIPLLIFAIYFAPTFLFAQDWAKHRQTVLDRPGLIRYYLFDDSVMQKNESVNLAPKKDTEPSVLSYRTKHPFEVVDGPFEGTKAVRIDRGFFESPKWQGVDKAFTVELRIRKLGQGEERGNSGATNGTLFGMGNGWDNGVRVTTDYPDRRLVFSIGRPTQEKSLSLVGVRPVPDDAWQHLAAVWDGKTMRLYVDGLLYGIIEYDGDLTDPCWGFRVGFNNAGVGSVKMDVAETAVYDLALEPEEILAHALLQPAFPDKHAALYKAAIDAVFLKDYPTASRKIDELLKLKMPESYRFAFRRYRAELAASSGNRTQAQRIYAELLADPNLRKEDETALLRQFATSDPNAVPAAPSDVYRKLLNDKSIEIDGLRRFATEKCLAEALFAEGPFSRDGVAEAAEMLTALGEREVVFVREWLEKQGVSPDFTKQYLDYRKEQERSGQQKTEIGKPSTPPLGSVSPAKRFYVAPGGKPGAVGTEADPFGSLTRARDAIRTLKTSNGFPATGVEVVVRGGVYPVTETIVLEKQDSGTEASPIVYRAAKGEKPVFTGGVTVKDFKKVDDPDVLKRLPEEARGKVFVASLAGAPVFPPVAPRGYGKNGLGAAPAVELFVDDKPQQIARWPNAPRPGAEDALKASEKAFVKTGKVHQGFFNTPESGKPGVFEYADPRHERWLEAADAMLFGYWGHLWGITGCRIEKIDPEKKQVVLATNNPYGYRENMPYYAFNLLEEIDEPGEWYLDRKNDKLYIYPPEGVDPNAAKVRLSCFSKEFLKLKDVSGTAFAGLTFEEGTGNAALVSGGENVTFAGCSFNRFGNWGLGLQGKNLYVRSCDFTALGGGGINLNGGDVKTLTPGDCSIENCVVNDFSRVDRAYAPAVLVDGVGNRIAHNLFCDSPGHAIRVEGMEHTIEFNEVHSIVYESDDQSGIDIWGNPFIRGMVFRYNYWHHIGSGRDVAGQAGIRLDDMISSVLMYGNVFFRSSGGHFGGIQIHGGKDNIVDGNLFIDCKYAVSFSPWGEKRWLELLERLGQSARQRGFDPDVDVYRTKYPDYADSKKNADRNIVTRNAAIGCDAFARNNRRNILLENIMLPWMPDLFPETKGQKKAEEGRVPAEARKIRSRISIPVDSPVYKLLGIRPIPVDSMGPYIDDYRTKLTETAVTPFFVLE